MVAVVIVAQIVVPTAVNVVVVVVIREVRVVIRVNRETVAIVNVRTSAMTIVVVVHAGSFSSSYFSFFSFSHF